MKRDRDDLEKSRTETDASIGIERAEADEVIARAVARADRQLDALIARDRVLADQGLTRFRQSADDLLAAERSAAPEPSSQVAGERLAADDNKRAERSATDSVFEDERRRADGRGEKRREARGLTHTQRETRRHQTNVHLSDERAEADAIAAERDMSSNALEAARNADAERSDVFAMVTHDLRTPLCVIVANADVIAKEPAGIQVREAAEDITHAAARMGRLVTDLFDVARIDAGTFSLDKRPHHVQALLSKIRHSFRPLFDGRGVALSVEVPPADVVASFDHDRVEQMLSNLLGNALKFTAPGGAVDVHVEHDTDELVLVVRDEGTGIHPEFLPHVFDRFSQHDRDGRRGLGLGLYLCRTIATAHGGDISVLSDVGAGSTFRVWLPMS